MPDLLYEIGAEEIPAGYIAPAIEQIERALVRELEAARLTYGATRTAATPRRLVVAVENVVARQPDAEEEVTGPPTRAAFAPDGTPTKAAIGFAKSLGVELSAIVRKQTPRGEYCSVRRTLKGRPAAEVLAEILPRITLEISFPKSMVWLPERKTFARPVRSLVALLGSEVVPFTQFGIASGRSVESHPILRPGRFDLADANFDRYKEALRQHFVLVEFPERQALIRAEIERALKPFGGAFREEALLNEVTNLVQYSMVLVGNFDPAFLSVPAAVVEAAMMEHQRYFPVRDAAGKLQPHFIVVSDRPAEHAGLIRIGNEQVLKARLADAQFFDEKDRHTRLEQHVPELKGIVYLKGRGTYLDKTQRLVKLVELLSNSFGLSVQHRKDALRAAYLCKADLLTEMVGEFPALQGTMGRIYAEREGETLGVAMAIEEHYLPRSADGELPTTPAGKVLSAADKIDNLTSCYMLGLVPTGSQDPYALRRQAQGLLRILETVSNNLSTKDIVDDSLRTLGASEADISKVWENGLWTFMNSRLEGMAEDRGIPVDLVRAVTSVFWGKLEFANNTSVQRQPINYGDLGIHDFWLRLRALQELSNDACWPNLVTAVERTYNISKSAPEGLTLDAALFKEPSEKTLGALLAANEEKIVGLEKTGDYAGASRKYAEVFAAPLHEFFEKVFVNVDDEELKNNRLELMRRVNRLYSARIADLSQITTGVQK